MYDLKVDPYQVESVSDDPSYLKTRLALIGLWDRLKDCTGGTCRIPTPLIPGPTDIQAEG